MSRVKLLVGIFLMALLLLALAACKIDLILPPEGSASTTVQPDLPQKDPWEVLKAVVLCVQSDNTNELVKYVHPKALERYGLAQIVERNAKIHADLGVKSIEYVNLAPIKKEEQSRQVFYSGEARYETSYGLLKKAITLSFTWQPEQQDWKLDWTPSLIIPGLNTEGKVRIEIQGAKRGCIYDRQGFPLAVNSNLIQVSLIPASFDLSNIDAVANLLGISSESLATKLAQPWAKGNVLVPIAILEKITQEQYKGFKRYNLEWSHKDSRSYPFAEALAPLLGYVGQPTAEELELEENRDLAADNLIGRAGLEQLYEQRLRGKSGYRIYISGSYEQTLLAEPAQNGADIYLSIDALCQRQIYEEIKDYNMTVSAVDPKTGDILALVSAPSYNPLAFVLGIAQAEYENLLQNPQQPLTAKFAFGLAPGSTQKLLTALIALSNGTVTTETRMYIEGKTWRKDDSWGNYAVSRYQEKNQEFTLEDALCYSDNIFFARLACEMGVEKFTQGMNNLGIGEQLCLDYPFAASQLCNQGQLPAANTVLLADTAYGQGELLVSPLHFASIYAALANEGQQYRPRLIISEQQPRPWHSKLASKADLAVLQQALLRVAEEQYAKQLARGELKLAGKSGTAELGLNPAGEMRLNSWFIGYAASNPSICLALTHFEAQEGERYFGIRKFGDIMESLYARRAYAVPPARLDKVRSEADIPAYVAVPHADLDPEDTQNE